MESDGSQLLYHTLSHEGERHSWPFGHRDTTTQSLLRTETCKRTSHFLAYSLPALVWQEQCQLLQWAINYLTERSSREQGTQLLGGRWLHWAISHTSCCSAPASSDFLIQAKSKLIRNVFFSFPQVFAHLYWSLRRHCLHPKTGTKDSQHQVLLKVGTVWGIKVSPSTTGSCKAP